jgi:hypothetical protein
VVALGSRVVVGAPFDGILPDAVAYGSVHVFDARSGLFERSIMPPPGGAAVAFGERLHGAGARLAVRTANSSYGLPGRIFLIDPATGEVARTIATPPVATDDYGGGFATTPSRMAVGLPGGGGAVDGVPGGVVQVFDPRDGRLLRTIASPGGAGEAFGAQLAIQGRRLLVLAPPSGRATNARTTAYLFDLRSGRLRGRLALASELDAVAAVPDLTGPVAFLRHGFVATTIRFLELGQAAQPEFTLEYHRRLPRRP